MSVIKKSNKAVLTVKKEKCKFFRNSVIFLGYRINTERFHIPSEIVEAILKFPSLQNIQEVKTFLS